MQRCAQLASFPPVRSDRVPALACDTCCSLLAFAGASCLARSSSAVELHWHAQMTWCGRHTVEAWSEDAVQLLSRPVFSMSCVLSCSPDSLWFSPSSVPTLSPPLPSQEECSFSWGSTLYHLEDLPFSLSKMPQHYGAFRDAVKGVKVGQPPAGAGIYHTSMFLNKLHCVLFASCCLSSFSLLQTPAPSV